MHYAEKMCDYKEDAKSHDTAHTDVTARTIGTIHAVAPERTTDFKPRSGLVQRHQSPGGDERLSI
ncbi:MAG: hypothetical protein KDB03_20420 [Planctomycetales bacterium]|nr:hypothetical protein [Planctomycetales bacterium]